MENEVRSKKAKLDHQISGGLSKVNIPMNKLYFISTSGDLKKLNPRVPKNFFTENGFEDDKVKRVCFANSVDKCLMALSMNCTNKEFYVYQPKNKHIVYKPSTQLVPDANVTGEHWIIEPVELICVGKIRCTGDAGRDGIQFKYGPHTVELYEWNFEWISRK